MLTASLDIFLFLCSFIYRFLNLFLKIKFLVKMAQTASTMLPLGTIAPDFYLKDTNSNDTYSFQDLRGSKGTLYYLSAIIVRLYFMLFQKSS